MSRDPEHEQSERSLYGNVQELSAEVGYRSGPLSDLSVFLALQVQECIYSTASA